MISALGSNHNSGLTGKNPMQHFTKQEVGKGKTRDTFKFNNFYPTICII